MLQAGDVLQQGDEAMKAGKHVAAARHYSEVLRMEEDNVEAHIKRARVYCCQDRHEHALSDIDRALELESENVEVCTTNCNMHMLLYCLACHYTSNLVSLVEDGVQLV